MKTKKMTKVLVALDYDPSAQKVAEAGFSLAKAMKADLILLHVVSDPINYMAPGNVTIMGFSGIEGIDPMQSDSVDALKKASFSFLEKSKLHLGDKTIQVMVEEGNSAYGILKTAKKMHVDVIVLGTHSRKWLENIVMGSVTQEVLRHTSIPLFIVPTKKRK